MLQIFPPISPTNIIIALSNWWICSKTIPRAHSPKTAFSLSFVHHNLRLIKASDKQYSHQQLSYIILTINFGGIHRPQDTHQQIFWLLFWHIPLVLSFLHICTELYIYNSFRKSLLKNKKKKRFKTPTHTHTA